jgi:hypothetical protein
MARFKNHLLVVVGFAIAGMIGAAFGTGTAQAVVASLVEVVNPTGSPVPTSVTNPGTSPVLSSSVDDPGRIAYQSLQTVSCTAESSCDFVLPTVPAGHRVVIQHISGIGSFTGTPTISYVNLKSNNQFVNFLVPTPNPGGRNFTAFDQPVLLYADPTDTVQVVWIVYGSSASFSGSNQQVTLIGYELDCTVAACAPIATQ